MPFLKDHTKVSYSRRLEKMAQRQGLRHAIFNTVGDKYIGEWQDDLKTGKGTLLTRFKQLYEGDFLEGFRHGFGVLAYQRADKRFMLEYRGYWRRGKMHGFGMRRYRDGSIYIGEWRRGRRHGYGLMWYVNTEFYAGEWARDRREGLGMLVLPHLDRYEGSWLADRKHGRGRYLHLLTGQMQNGVWRVNECIESTFHDIKYRQTAPYVTFFPIQDIELLDWLELCKLYETYALEDRQRSCLDFIEESTINCN